MKNGPGSVFLLIVLFFGFPLSDADAQSQEALRDCRAVADADARLDCYDAIADSLPAPTTAVAAPTPAPAPDRPAVSDVEFLPPIAATAPESPTEPTVATAAASERSVAAASDDSDFGDEQLEPEAEARDSLVSRIVGDYDGWWGDTVFRLENGQTWVQAQSGKSRYRGAPNPTVTIRRRALGSYRLQVEGSNKTVRVKRLK